MKAIDRDERRVITELLEHAESLARNNATLRAALVPEGVRHGEMRLRIIALERENSGLRRAMCDAEERAAQQIETLKRSLSVFLNARIRSVKEET